MFNAKSSLGFMGCRFEVLPAVRGLAESFLGILVHFCASTGTQLLPVALRSCIMCSGHAPVNCLGDGQTLVRLATGQKSAVSLGLAYSSIWRRHQQRGQKTLVVSEGHGKAHKESWPSTEPEEGWALSGFTSQMMINSSPNAIQVLPLPGKTKTLLSAPHQDAISMLLVTKEQQVFMVETSSPQLHWKARTLQQIAMLKELIHEMDQYSWHLFKTKWKDFWYMSTDEGHLFFYSGETNRHMNST